MPLGQSGLRRKLGCRRGTRHCRRLLVEQPHLRDFKNSPEIIRLVVRRHVRHALALSKVEDQLHERGIENAWNQAKRRLADCNGIPKGQESA